MERDFSICWYILQIPATARAGLGQRQASGTPSGSPEWVAGALAENRMRCRGAGTGTGSPKWMQVSQVAASPAVPR